MPDFLAAKRPMGIDVNKGIGTAYEGYVRVSSVFNSDKKKIFIVECENQASYCITYL